MASNDSRQLTPQLAMVRDTLLDIPEVKLPDGYEIRTYLPGDGAAWERIIGGSFEKEMEPGSFDSIMRDDSAFRPERIFFVMYDSMPAATASAWYMPEYGEEYGYLHYVGCANDHRGKGLGKTVNYAALHHMKKEGRTKALLRTDDFRIPAIKTYLKLGFKPLLMHENQGERWRNILSGIDADLIEKFKDNLSGPLFLKPEFCADDFDVSRFENRRRWNKDRIYRGPGDYNMFSDEHLYKSSEFGRAGIRPLDTDRGTEVSETRMSVAAGSDVPFSIWYETGETILRPGTYVGFCIHGQSPLGTVPQVNDRENPGYMEITSPDTCEVTCTGLGFYVEKGILNQGDRIELLIGVETGFQWTVLAGKREIKVAVHMHKDEPQLHLPEPLVVDIEPLAPESLEVILPGTHRDKQINVSVCARDMYDNRVPLNTDIALSLEDLKENHPMVKGKTNICIKLSKEPIRVYAECKEIEGRFVSNTSVASDDKQLYFGDLHCHDFLSTAEGYSDKVYEWAIQERCLDFISVPVQVHNYIDNEKWTIAKYMNERFLDEGSFVTFLAFEWQHSHYGDKVVHFLGNDQPYLPLDDSRYTSPAKLYEAVKRSDAFVIGHHVGLPLDRHVPGTDWEAVDTEVERLAEIWSMHGSSEGYDPDDRPLKETTKENTALEALKRGIRIGFTGGSDTHSARPAGSCKEPRPYFGGVCGVWAEELTRRSVFRAFMNRHTYALTGARIVLKMEVNGALMGSEIEASDSALINIDVWAPCSIQKVEILKNGILLKECGSFSDEAHIEEQDSTGGSAFYHARVTCEDGSLGVTSPVWLG
ncbi:GNAT family N-acetyltransferase [Planctomycetota bacterium]